MWVNLLLFTVNPTSCNLFSIQWKISGVYACLCVHMGGEEGGGVICELMIERLRVVWWRLTLLYRYVYVHANFNPISIITKKAPVATSYVLVVASYCIIHS